MGVLIMERAMLIEKLMWNGEENRFWWQKNEEALDNQKMFHNHRVVSNHMQKDCKSVVVINGEKDIYTDKEIEMLYDFSSYKVEENDLRYNDRMFTNKIVITKTTVDELKYFKPWMGRRESNDAPSKVFNTLIELIQYFSK